MCRLDGYQPNQSNGEKTMKTKWSVLTGAVLVALLVVGVLGATNAYAKSVPNDLFFGSGPDRGRGPHLGTAELEAAAKALNMTTDELTTALQSGKTLEQVAQDAGVDFAVVQSAVQAAHATEMRERIQQAVEDGTITQENADWLLEGLDKGFIGVPGGFGFDGHHGPKLEQAPTGQPTP
jgi:hypothetical protein